MKKPHLPTQQGLSLVEILIAMVIGVFLMAGIIQIFISSKETYRTQEGLSRLQENGRFAMEFLARDIRMTDFLGCLKDGLDNAVISNTAGITTLGIEGTNGATDTITLRGGFDNIAVATTLGTTSIDSTTMSNNGLATGDIVLVSDCTQGDIFQITNTSPGTTLSKLYRDDAKIYKFATTVFSIQTGAGGQPALFKQVNGATPVELVEGIENMQILYGVDTDNPADNTANLYVPASSLVAAPGTPNMNQVVSVRISILARTVSEVANLASQPIPYTYNGATTTPTDRQLRRVFTSTFTLRNRLN